MKKEISIEGAFNRWVSREPTSEELSFIFPHNKEPKRVLQRINRGERFLTAVETYKICDLLKVTPDMLEVEIDAQICFRRGNMKLSFNMGGHYYEVLGELTSDGYDFEETFVGEGGRKQLRVFKDRVARSEFNLSLNKALGSFIYNVVKEVKNLENVKKIGKDGNKKSKKNS